MRIRLPLFSLTLGAVALAACGGTPQSGTPTPQPAAAAAGAPGQATLAGDWAVQLQVQGQASNGTMRLSPSGGGYTGIFQLDTASQVSSIRSLTVDGTHFVAVLTTPDGDATIEGNLRTAALMEAMYNGRHGSGRFIASRR
jgi:hypothetical protein